MAQRDWNAHYEEGFLPWDTDEPDPNLVAFVEGHELTPGRALDIGCGTGTNAVWLASLGFEVLGVDVAPRAVERAEARAKATPTDGRCSFATFDFLDSLPPGGPFDMVFDRGCFHVFDEPDDRARFAAQVAECLAPQGQWLSLIGSTEGPPREFGPPRRSARDITNAIEPALEITELRTAVFDVQMPEAPRAWVCVSRQREVPAQPS
ncbi:MAG: class I SAM-dependent methyltransferase [Aeromicrobium sp.]